MLEPPCESCPKYRLYPGPTYGLHPGNFLAVSLYYKAYSQHRVGTFGGAFLLGTMTNESARAVLDLHDHLIVDDLHRQTLFDKMKLIDRIATQKVCEDEDRQRKAAEAQAESKAKTRSRR